MDLETFIARKIAHSRAAFGPNQTLRGVLKHLQKECDEVNEALYDDKPWPDVAEEFVDCLFLSLDGIWRAVAIDRATGAGPAFTDDIAEVVYLMIKEKLNIVEAREWPDYRKLSPDEAREHIKG